MDKSIEAQFLATKTNLPPIATMSSPRLQRDFPAIAMNSVTIALTVNSRDVTFGVKVPTQYVGASAYDPYLITSTLSFLVMTFLSLLCFRNK